jgi:hypothetical protein
VTGAELIPVCPRALRLGRPRNRPHGYASSAYRGSRL